MVLGGDSRSEGRGFESQHLGGHFLQHICCKNCNNVCLKRPKINDKRGRSWPILKKLTQLDTRTISHLRSMSVLFVSPLCTLILGIILPFLSSSIYSTLTLSLAHKHKPRR